MASEYEQVLILAWTFCAVALLLTLGRYAIRFRNSRKLLADDIAHGIAAILLIGFNATYTVMFPSYFPIAEYAAGAGPAPSEEDLITYLHTAVAMQFLLWAVIYAIKIAFMLFYRQIFSISPQFMLAWNIVLVYTIIGYLASFLATFWACGDPSKLFVMPYCFDSAAARAANTFPAVLVALNGSGDLALMALPLWMLRSLKMPLSQKIGLSCVFLLGCVTIAIDVTRVSVGKGGNSKSLAWVWDIVEPNLAVVISCLPTYRGLFLPSRNRGTTAYLTTDHNSRIAMSRKANKSHKIYSQSREIDFPETSASSEELKPADQYLTHGLDTRKRNS